MLPNCANHVHLITHLEAGELTLSSAAPVLINKLEDFECCSGN